VRSVNTTRRSRWRAWRGAGEDVRRSKFTVIHHPRREMALGKSCPRDGGLDLLSIAVFSTFLVHVAGNDANAECMSHGKQSQQPLYNDNDNNNNDDDNDNDDNNAYNNAHGITSRVPETFLPIRSRCAKPSRPIKAGYKGGVNKLPKSSFILYGRRS